MAGPPAPRGSVEMGADAEEVRSRRRRAASGQSVLARLSQVAGACSHSATLQESVLSGDFVCVFFRDPWDLFKLNGGLNPSSVADQ